MEQLESARASVGVGGIAGGASLVVEAARMLRRESSLWLLASVPVAISMLAVALVVGWLGANASELYQGTSGWLPWPEPGGWPSWLWVGPARALLWLLGGLLFVLAIVVALVLALLSASIASAPFLDRLSLRVERLVAPQDVPSQSRGVVADGLQSLWNETRRVSFFAALWLAIWLAGALIPGGAIVAGPLLLLLTVFFLPLDYTGYSLDRRAIAFDRRRGWMRSNWGTMLGFGGAAFAVGVVPGLNLLLLPLLVVGGTLLVLRHPLA